MLKFLSRLVKDITPTNDPKEKVRRTEKKKRKEIIKRQKTYERAEVVQTWRIAMGSEIPKKIKDTFVITNITRRNIWMEEDFIFNQIKAQFPEDIFHSIDRYAFKWQPPGSYFQVIVPLDDPVLQENALLVMNRLLPQQQKTVLFLFSPIDPAMNMFAPKVHPASLVSYRTKNEVLKKLSTYYLEGRMTLDELQQIFTCDYEIWKSALYNYLPADEQVYHTYLNEKPLAELLAKPLHKSYIDGDITIEEYENLKYPDRKKKKEMEAKDYPIPFEGNDCIICGKEKLGAIKCYTCDNMVCVQCIKDVFHSSADHQGRSFLLMHHKYCMKLGELPEIALEKVQEEAWLREFRKETRLTILKKYIPDYQPDYDDYAPLEDIVDDEELLKQQLAEKAEKERQEKERQRLLLENPMILQELRERFNDKKKRYDRYYKDIQDYTEKINDKSHTEQFIARNSRLRNEILEKLKINIQIPYSELMEELEKLEIPGEFYQNLVKEVSDVLNEIDIMIKDYSPPGEKESDEVSGVL
jgi:hypothetical protein